MTNKIIIDGWNLAWKIPEVAKFIPDDLPRARQTLHARLSGYFQQKKIAFRIIYDGKPGIENNLISDIKIGAEFTSDPEKADHKIIKQLRKERQPERWTVITSDRELAGRARNLGAASVNSEEFISKLNKVRSESDNPEKNDPRLSKTEIDFWLDQFSNSDPDKPDKE